MKTKPSLSEYFANMRGQRNLTYAIIGELCDLHETSVWKVEHDLSVRWETLHLILTIGMGIKMGSPTYNKFHVLWLEDKAAKAATRRMGKGKKNLSKEAAEAVKQFREVVRPLNDSQIHKVMLAAHRAAVNALC